MRSCRIHAISRWLSILVATLCGLDSSDVAEKYADCKFERLADRPRLFRCRGFAGPQHLSILAAEANAALERKKKCRQHRCWSWVDKEHLTSPLAGLVEALYSLLPDTTVVEARKTYTRQPLNVLLYEIGGATASWHTDAQGQRPTDIMVSAILYVQPASVGGQTSFRDSMPEPVSVTASAGDLLIWYSCDHTGEDDPKSLHRGVEVEEGQKLIFEKFFELPRWVCSSNFTFEAKIPSHPALRAGLMQPAASLESAHLEV